MTTPTLKKPTARRTLRIETPYADLKGAVAAVRPAAFDLTALVGKRQVASLSVTGRDAILRGSDFETTVQRTLKGAGKNKGEVLIDLRRVDAALRAVAVGRTARQTEDLPVQIEAVEVKTSDGTTHTQARILAAGIILPVSAPVAMDYPAPGKPGKTVGVFALTELVSTLERVAYAAANSYDMPLLAAIHAEVREQDVVLTTTDRYRLAQDAAQGQVEADAVGASMLIPAGVVRSIKSALVHEKVTLTQDVERNMIRFADGENYVEVRLVDGIYPNLHSVFAINNDAVKCSVVRTDLANALRRVRAIETAMSFSRKSRALEVELASPGELRLAPVIDQTGEPFPVTLPGVPMASENFVTPSVLGVNTEFLWQALRSFVGKGVDLHIRAATRRPLHMTSSERPSHRVILMPAVLAITGEEARAGWSEGWA